MLRDSECELVFGLGGSKLHAHQRSLHVPLSCSGRSNWAPLRALRATTARRARSGAGQLRENTTKSAFAQGNRADSPRTQFSPRPSWAGMPRPSLAIYAAQHACGSPVHAERRHAHQRAFAYEGVTRCIARHVRTHARVACLVRTHADGCVTNGVCTSSCSTLISLPNSAAPLATSSKSDQTRYPSTPGSMAWASQVLLGTTMVLPRPMVRRM